RKDLLGCNQRSVPERDGFVNGRIVWRVIAVEINQRACGPAWVVNVTVSSRTSAAKACFDDSFQLIRRAAEVVVLVLVTFYGNRRSRRTITATEAGYTFNSYFFAC